MAPVIRTLNQAKLPNLFIHSGQHYDYNMSQQFIENLELASPDWSFKVRSSSPGEQTARIIGHMDKVLKKTSPSIVLVEGDTNTVLAAALAGVFLRMRGDIGRECNPSGPEPPRGSDP